MSAARKVIEAPDAAPNEVRAAMYTEAATSLVAAEALVAAVRALLTELAGIELDATAHAAAQTTTEGARHE